ncbi:MAG: triple tyrosine motif-containing protein, partial [Bacteroidota bacterium]
ALMVNAAHRLFRFDPETETATIEPLTLDDGTPLEFADMEVGADGALWLSTYNAGLARFELGTGALSTYGPREGLMGQNQRPRRGAGGTLWVQSEAGLYEYDPARDRFEQRLLGRPLLPGRNPFISACYVDALDIAWCHDASRTDLVAIDLATGVRKVFEHDRGDPDSIPANGITRVFEDRAGVLWVVGMSEVRRVVGRQGLFQRVAGVPDGLLRVGTARDGSLLAAEFCGGVYQLSGGTLVPDPRLPGNRGSCSMTVTETSDGALWVGTWPWRGAGGLWRSTEDGPPRYFTSSDAPGSLARNGVRVVHEDRTGTIWVGSSVLQRYDPATESFEQAPLAPGEAFSGTDIWALAEDDEGMLWVSFYTVGVDRYDPATGRIVARYTHVREDLATLGANVVPSIEPSHATPGIVWIATWGGGLNRLDVETGRVRRYTRADGFPDTKVNQVVEDPRGTIWASTVGGLVRLDPETDAVRVFGRADGILGYGGLAGLVRLGDGRLALADGEGLSGNALHLFDPADFDLAAPSIPLVLTALEVGGERYPAAPRPEEVRIAPAIDFFGFEFAALGVISPERVRYRHRLDGFDDDWVTAQDRRYAAYTSLTPGRYTFRVEANAGAGWTGALAVPVIVEPHWWERRSVRLVGLLLALAAGVLFVRFLATRRLQRELRRLEVERRLQDERERISQDLHDHVGAQLSTIVSGIDLARLASNAEGRADRGDGAPVKAASYLDRLEAHARTTMAQLRETIWALHHETVTLQAFHDRLCAYARTQAGLRPNAPRIACHLHAANPAAVLTPMQALNLYRIAQEAVENVLKHAAASHLTIDVQAGSDALVLVVEDDGAFAEAGEASAPGVADDLRGFGLDGMRRRAE